MKIRILKDIPGYKAGETVGNEDFHGEIESFKTGNGFSYRVKPLIYLGYAEEIHDDIYIETIRNNIRNEIGNFERYRNDYLPEGNWFKSYLIVKAVIDKLNGDWKPNWENREIKVAIYWDFPNEKTEIYVETIAWHSQLPPCKDEETAQKVIKLCDKELKVLFGVKK